MEGVLIFIFKEKLSQKPLERILSFDFETNLLLLLESPPVGTWRPTDGGRHRAPWKGKTRKALKVGTASFFTLDTFIDQY